MKTLATTNVLLVEHQVEAVAAVGALLHVDGHRSLAGIILPRRLRWANVCAQRSAIAGPKSMIGHGRPEDAVAAASTRTRARLVAACELAVLPGAARARAETRIWRRRHGSARCRRLPLRPMADEATPSAWWSSAEMLRFAEHQGRSMAPGLGPGIWIGSQELPVGRPTRWPGG